MTTSRHSNCSPSCCKRHGHAVVTRNNGTEALAYLRDEPQPRLILLDLNMPMMDGYELRALIAASEDLSRIPIIAMTSNRTSPDPSSVPRRY